MTLKTTSECTGEIYVCGVKKRFHRSGTGSAMFRRLCEMAQSMHLRYLQVKTVAAGVWPEYDATRKCYERMCFCPLEVFPTLWDERNPCLIMVRSIG